MRMIRTPARKSPTPRRATNVSLPAELIDEAKRLDINISKACEQGLEQQVSKSRAEQWLAENREALDSWNAWVEEHGMPYAEYRQF